MGKRWWMPKKLTRKKKPDHPKYSSVQDLVPFYTSKKNASVLPGEPIWVYLRRYELDRALRGSQHLRCCGCGLLHLFTYEVHTNGRKRQWWINVRAYSDSETWPKKVVDAKGKIRRGQGA